MKQLIHVPNIIHGTDSDDGNYDGDVGDDNYDLPTNWAQRNGLQMAPK